MREARARAVQRMGLNPVQRELHKLFEAVADAAASGDERQRQVNTECRKLKRAVLYLPQMAMRFLEGRQMPDGSEIGKEVRLSFDG